MREIRQCNGYLKAELDALQTGAAVLALGVVAHQAVLLAHALKPAHVPFRHGARHALARGLALFDSYHCSRYNTQTRRLSAPMFEAVFAEICDYLKSAE
jgi:uracil-DNA glycosylase